MVADFVDEGEPEKRLQDVINKSFEQDGMGRLLPSLLTWARCYAQILKDIPNTRLSNIHDSKTDQRTFERPGQQVITSDHRGGPKLSWV